MSNQVAIRRNSERKIRSIFVTKEMFIVRLDRPWRDTPFWLQGFLVASDEELKAINKYCDFVYIDIVRGKTSKFYMDEGLELPTNRYLEENLINKKKQKARVKYRLQTCLKDELVTAKGLLESITAQYVLMMQGIKKGKSLDIMAIYALIEPIIESIIRNSDAFVLLIRLRIKKEYTFSHEIDACVIAILFGRYMGLEINDLKMLAAGVLLFDIGKLKIDDSILNKTKQLTDDEFKQVNRHVDYGVDILRNVKGLPADVFNIMLTHHERFDGSGYPNGLQGLKIPIYGRMAAVIDCYDAMTSNRSYSKSVTPAHALQQIYSWRGSLYQPELVDEFLNCMGVYPNGSFVELNSGEIGIVLSQNNSYKLNPRILLVLDSDKKAYKKTEIIDLSKENLTKSGRNMIIMKDVDPVDLGVNTEVIYESISSIIPQEAVPIVPITERISKLVEKVF